ncbi:MAG: GTP 3',8-cyclase MoaA [Blautia sp.]|nr:GTP 3',8-cyclase MoaA [Blautia sp.]
MKDSFGRTIDYMRVSITDRCNLRCRYCMPEDIDLVPMSQILSMEEFAQAAKAAAALGICHIKLTGGEPLIRKGLDLLIRLLKSTPGIEKVTLTTNGILLREKLESLMEAGLDAVNISLDTTDPEKYRQITGRDGVSEVLAALDQVCKKGLPVKINAVSVRQEKRDIQALVNLAKDRPVDVRFIEMMPIGNGKDFPAMSNPEIFEILKGLYPGLKEDKSQHGFGPASYYTLPGYEGSIGFISAIHGKFCKGCNRVRLTSQGYLKTCLCYENGTDLRRILRSDLPEEEIQRQLILAIQDAVEHKPREHCFESAEAVTEAATMNAIGG